MGQGYCRCKSTLFLIAIITTIPLPCLPGDDDADAWCHNQPGGQDSQLVAPDLSTHLDSQYLLQTHDHPPAYVAVKNEGWRVGPRDVLEKLEDPSQADEVDPKSYSFRVYIHM